MLKAYYLLGCGLVTLFRMSSGSAVPQLPQSMIACPEQLDTDQVVRHLPVGFSAAPGESLVSRLALVSFTEGDATPGADVPPEQHQEHGQIVRVWQFSGSGTVWLHCSYAATRLVLTRELPKTLSQCTAVLNPRVRIAGEPKLMRLECS